MIELMMKAIGVIHTPILEKANAPIQSSRSEIIGTAEIFPQYREGLEGIEGFSHIYLVYQFHCAEPDGPLQVHPFLDDKLQGVFATRFPNRPNPIGFSVVELLERKEYLLVFKGADMLEGTPLLDLKPYIPEFDVFSVNKTGWFQNKKHPFK